MSQPTFLLLALSWTLWLAGACQIHAQPASSVKTVSDTVALNPSSTVEIDNHRGSITVRSWDRAEVGYRVRIASSTKDDDLPFTALEVSRSDDKLELEPDHPWRFRIPGVIVISPGGTERAAFHFTVAVPTSANLRLDSYASTINLDGPAGNVKIDTHSGSVEATALSGGLTLDKHAGEADLSFERLTAPISIESFSGPIRITVPRTAGFNLETDLRSIDQLTTSNGLSLPSPTANNVEGAVNGGGPSLWVDAHSGTIELRTHRSASAN